MEANNDACISRVTSSLYKPSFFSLTRAASTIVSVRANIEIPIKSQNAKTNMKISFTTVKENMIDKQAVCKIQVQFTFLITSL